MSTNQRDSQLPAVRISGDGLEGVERGERPSLEEVQHGTTRFDPLLEDAAERHVPIYLSGWIPSFRLTI